MRDMHRDINNNIVVWETPLTYISIMKKHILFFFLSIFCLNAINAEVTCDWSEDGTLTISGNGEMDECKNIPILKYPLTDYPWIDVKDMIKRVVIENGIINIGDNAFSTCVNLTSVIIPNTVTSIGAKAFSGCSSLTSVTIPDGVTSIGREAFRACSITSITIPNSVTDIGYNAFYECKELSSVNFPKASYCNFDEGMFGSTKWYREWYADENANNYLYLGDCLFAYKGNDKIATIKNGTKKILKSAFSNCSGLTSVTIPNSVTSIDGYAFSGCSGLTSIAIPNSVTSIGEYAFNGCSGFTSVAIPSSVTSIGEYAFSGCSSLISITIPNGVVCIEDNTFSRCYSLTTVTIPQSVTEIDGGAFEDCYKLKEIYLLNPIPPQFVSTSFKNVSFQHVKLFVPEGAADSYKYQLPSSVIWEHGCYWNIFANIYEVNNSSILMPAEPITRNNIQHLLMYNLNGEMVNKNTLKHGVYIKNGKKVIVK